MLFVLILLPLLTYISVVFLYRFSGKKTFLHFDLVQFIYAFFIYPLIYVWGKQFIYYLVRSELGVSISIGQWIVIDTIFSLIFMFFYGFGIIHSLTKTFALEIERDPLFDLFAQSEYFHEFLSHAGMYSGIVLVLAVLGSVNAIFPFLINENKPILYLFVVLGVLAGLLMYIGFFIMTNIDSNKYKRLMRLLVGLAFTLQMVTFYVLNPDFSIQYIFYWTCLFMFASCVLSFFFINPSKRFGVFFEKKLKPQLSEISVSVHEGPFHDQSWEFLKRLFFTKAKIKIDWGKWVRIIVWIRLSDFVFEGLDFYF